MNFLQRYVQRSNAPGSRDVHVPKLFIQLPQRSIKRQHKCMTRIPYKLFNADELVKRNKELITDMGRRKGDSGPPY